MTTSSLRLIVGLCLTAVFLAACQTAPANRGTSGRRMDPTSDSPAELGVRAPRSADLVNATDRMAQDIASRIDIVNPDSPPRIFVGQMENHTTNRHQNYQVFLDRLKGQLQTSGARRGLQFIAPRTTIEEYRAREYGTKIPESSAAAYRSRADYALIGKISDFVSGGSNYYFIQFELVQLRDAATGPDVGRGAVIWEGFYEVKFQ